MQNKTNHSKLCARHIYKGENRQAVKNNLRYRMEKMITRYLKKTTHGNIV